MAAVFHPIPTQDPDPPRLPTTAHTSTAHTSRPAAQGDNNQEQEVPLLTLYDPYHDTTYSAHHPLTEKPLTGDEVDVRTLLFGATQPCWRLDYQDFAPTVTGLDCNAPRCMETFQDLVDRANSWLRQNPQVRVRTVESLSWWVSEPVQVGDTETVVLEQCNCHKQDADTFYLIGLRLWVVPRPEGLTDPVQQLRSRDFQATERENLGHLVRRVNRRLEDEPCPGAIMTTETVLVPEIPSRDTGVLLWRDSQCQRGEYSLFLRIFFVEGQPLQESIGIHNVCPEVVSGGHEPFSALMQKARCWVNSHHDIQVTNLKSCYVSRQNECPSDCANRCRHQYFKFTTYQYFQVVRVFYVKRLLSSSPSYHLLNYVTFTPVQTLMGPTTMVPFEKMRHTMIRTMAWLRAAGAEVFCAETVMTPLVPSLPSQTLPEVTYWTPTSTASEGNIRKCLMHIRVYLEGEYKEPDPTLLPPLPLSLTTSIQATIRQREIKRYNKRKQRRKRRKRVFLILAFLLMAAAAGVIILDQVFNVFR